MPYFCCALRLVPAHRVRHGPRRSARPSILQPCLPDAPSPVLQPFETRPGYTTIRPFANRFTHNSHGSPARTRAQTRHPEGKPAAPKIPTSCRRSSDRSQLPACLAPQFEPHVVPSRRVPRLSSLALTRIRQRLLGCRVFTPAQPNHSVASSEGVSLQRLQKTDYLLTVPLLQQSKNF